METIMDSNDKVIRRSRNLRGLWLAYIAGECGPNGGKR
jgi:hypothetical protein